MVLSQQYADLETAPDAALAREYEAVIEALDDLYSEATMRRDDDAVLAEEARLNARAYDLHVEVQRRQRLRLPFADGAHV